MRRITHVLFAASLAALLLVPAGATAQSQDIDGLRRRVEDVERQLFQQRLNTPLTSHDASLGVLQQRLERLERELAAQRISDIAAEVTTKRPVPQVMAAEIEELKAARAADAKTIEKLTARIAALEKAKPPVRRKQ